MIKNLNKKKTITIKYNNLMINPKSTDFAFSLASVVNQKLLNEHLKKIEDSSFLLSHNFKLNIPNSVFKLNLSTKEIILERWWFDKVKETFFITKEQAIYLKVGQISFKNVVKAYLSKTY